MASPLQGHNAHNPETIKKYYSRIMAKHDELESEKGKYMSTCKRIKEERNQVYALAKEEGVDVRALKARVKSIEFEKKAQKCKDDLEPENQESYDQIAFALGDLAGLPLGQAVLNGAGVEATI